MLFRETSGFKNYARLWIIIILVQWTIHNPFTFNYISISVVFPTGYSATICWMKLRKKKFSLFLWHTLEDSYFGSILHNKISNSTMKGDADFVCILYIYIYISLNMKMNLFHSSCVPCTSVGDGRAAVTEPLALRALSSPQWLAVRYSDKYLVS